MSSPTVFISCEDDMPKILGVHNFACTVTGALIVVVPVLIIRKRRRVNAPYYEIKAYYLSLLLLFLGNLVEHATAYVGPPSLDACGALFSLSLLAMTYRAWYYDDEQKRLVRHHDNQQQQTSSTSILPSSSTLSTTMLVLGIVLLCSGFLVSPELEALFVICLSPVSAANIVLLGYMSYYKRGSTWFWFCFSLVGFVVVQISVEWEKGACEKLERQLTLFKTSMDLRRLYHSVYLHTIIPLLFWGASECAFGVIMHEDMNKRQQYDVKNMTKKLR